MMVMHLIELRTTNRFMGLRTLNGDITTTANLDHLMQDLDSTRSNMMVIIIIKYPFMIMEAVRTYSDETVMK